MISLIQRKLHAFVLVILTSVILSACASQPPVPPDRFYRLHAVLAAEPLSRPLFNGTMEVDRFSADGLTAGRPIIYVQASDPNQLLEYHYHFWTQPPTIMLRDETVTFLRKAKVADQVVTPEMRLSPNLVMTARVRKLEQVLGTPNRTVMELEVSIRRPDDGSLVFLKSYKQESVQNGAGVSSAVDALNEAFNVILSDLLEDLKSL